MKFPLGVNAQIKQSSSCLELRGMLKIRAASSVENACLIISICQVPLKGTMRELTFASVGTPSGEEIMRELTFASVGTPSGEEISLKVDG